jgi:hypothetical protein
MTTCCVCWNEIDPSAFGETPDGVDLVYICADCNVGIITIDMDDHDDV